MAEKMETRFWSCGYIQPTTFAVSQFYPSILPSPSQIRSFFGFCSTAVFCSCAHFGTCGGLLFVSGMATVRGCQDVTFYHPLLNSSMQCSRVCPPYRSTDADIFYCSKNCPGMIWCSFCFFYGQYVCYDSSVQLRLCDAVAYWAKCLGVTPFVFKWYLQQCSRP